MRNRISVCIPTFQRAESLNMVLAGLLAHDCISQVLIAQQRSRSNLNFNPTTHRLIAALRQKGLGVDLGVVDDPIAAAKFFGGCAAEDISLWLDDDVIPGYGYIDLMRHFNHDEKVAAVSGSIQSPTREGYIDWSADKVDMTLADDELVNEFEIRDNGETLWENKYQVYRITEQTWSTREAFLLFGSAMFLRTSAWDLMDDFFAGFTGDVPNYIIHEIDLTTSLRRRGYKLLFDPSATAWHIRYRGNRHVDPAGSDEISQRNWSYYLRKHGLGSGERPETYDRDRGPGAFHKQAR